MAKTADQRRIERHGNASWKSIHGGTAKAERQNRDHLTAARQRVANSNHENEVRMGRASGPPPKVSGSPAPPEGYADPDMRDSVDRRRKQMAEEEERRREYVGEQDKARLNRLAATRGA